MWFCIVHELDILTDNTQSHDLRGDTDCVKEISNFAPCILVDEDVKFVHFLTKSKLDDYM